MIDGRSPPLLDLPFMKITVVSVFIFNLKQKSIKIAVSKVRILIYRSMSVDACSE